ncbi:MAG: 4a-hydroxytetrahydrobiopterin dehydratase [Gammaproteobacteria bacterium]|jgi:4a-hydroxytetrahydrobiopterin dehydratase
MSLFADKQCDAETSLLTDKEIAGHLQEISPEWRLSEDNKSIARTFKFKNYYDTMAFVNVVAMVAHRQDHHPDMTVTYNTCRVEFSTHSVGGLSLNDFICAAKVDGILKI